MLMLPSVRLSNPGQPHGSILYYVCKVLSTPTQRIRLANFVKSSALLFYVQIYGYFQHDLVQIVFPR